MAANKPKVGFIGLGLMGQAFTKRLTACGYEVNGYDIVSEKMASAAGRGVRAMGSPAEVARASDVVQICVMTKDDLAAAVFGVEGIASGGVAGMGWIDAPVSGGPPAAEAGTLAIMAGGNPADITKVEPVMADLAGVFTHMGPVGAGQITKMVNQVLVLTNYCVLAEALALAEAGGVDAAKIPAALATGHAGSNMLKNLYPRLLERDFEPAGYARQILKDLGMVHDLAQQLKVPTPMASQAASLFEILVSKGHGELDGIAVLKLYDGRERV